MRFTPENINYSASCTLSKRAPFLIVRPKTQYKSPTVQSLISGYLRCQLTSSKTRIGGVAHIHRDTTAKNQVPNVQTCCVGHDLLISSGIAPPYYTYTELRFTRNFGSFVKQDCVVLGLWMFTDNIASPQPYISSLFGFTHAEPIIFKCSSNFCFLHIFDIAEGLGNSRPCFLSNHLYRSANCHHISGH